MPENQELIWVDKDFAEKHKEILSAKNKRDEQEKVFDEYFETLTDRLREDFRVSLEGLEEDAAIFTGLMLKVKQSFGKALDEHLNSSYELWENFDKELPSTTKKVNEIVELLDPLEKKLTTIRDLIGKIDKWQIDKFIESLSLMTSMYGKNKEMMEFLIKNFNTEQL